MHRIPFCLLLLALLACVPCPPASAEEEDWTWLLEDYLPVAEANGRGGTLTIDSLYGFRDAVPEQELDSYEYSAVTTIDMGEFPEFFEESLPLLTPDVLVPCEHIGNDAEEALCYPMFFYRIEYEGEVVLEVVMFGLVTHRYSPVRINGHWFEQNVAVYEIIWPFLPQPIKEKLMRDWFDTPADIQEALLAPYRYIRFRFDPYWAKNSRQFEKLPVVLTFGDVNTPEEAIACFIQWHNKFWRIDGEINVEEFCANYKVSVYSSFSSRLHLRCGA